MDDSDAVATVSVMALATNGNHSTADMSLALPGQVSPVGWMPPERLSLEEWGEVGPDVRGGGGVTLFGASVGQQAINLGLRDTPARAPAADPHALDLLLPQPVSHCLGVDLQSLGDLGHEQHTFPLHRDLPAHIVARDCILWHIQIACVSMVAHFNVFAVGRT